MAGGLQMSSQIFRDGLMAGQVCLVTGGGTGIGAATARELGYLGANVVIASRKEEHIRPAAAGLSEQIGREVVGELCDIRDRESVAGVYERILERFGRLDVLVNNGGGQFFSPAEAISPKGFDAVVATNLTGTWNMIRGAADSWMLENGGRIINITMLTRVFCGMAHSVAARGGVEAMTRTLAVEWAARGILLNCVAPGYVASSGIKRYPAGLELMRTMKSKVPLKRLSTCDEIAWMIAYLVGPAGGYITGQTMTVDGGKDLWGDYWPIPDPPDMGPVVVPKEPWEKED
jgi:NAD(P)-dependent dehydrogenase (short-subunit alcohol dehydrogenase family)